MREEDLKGVVATNAFWNFLATFINRIGALIFTLIITRYLLPENFGIYSIALSISTVLLAFADLGINQTMVRYVSVKIRNDKQKAIAYFRYLLKIKVFLAATFSVILGLSSYFIASTIYHHIDLFPALILFSIYIFVFALIGFFESLFYINKQVKFIAIKEVILQASRIIIVLLFFFSLTFALYLKSVIIAIILSGILAFIFIFIILKKQIYSLIKVSKETIDKKKILEFVIFLTISSIANIVFANTDAIILGVFLPPEFVGYYRAALSLVAGIAGLLSFTNFLLPVLTQIRNAKKELICNKILRYSFILTIPASLGLIAMAKYFIYLVYGYEYQPATIILFFLALLIIPFASSNLFYVLSSAMERPKHFAKATLFLALYNVFLNITFILFLKNYSPMWAAAGAAFATILSYYIYFINLFILSKKKLKINLDYKLIFKPLFAGLIMLLVLLLFNALIKDMTLIKGLAEVILGIVVYFFSLYMINGIEKEDFLFIKLVLNKKTSIGL